MVRCPGGAGRGKLETRRQKLESGVGELDIGGKAQSRPGRDKLFRLLPGIFVAVAYQLDKEGTAKADRGRPPLHNPENGLGGTDLGPGITCALVRMHYGRSCRTGGR